MPLPLISQLEHLLLGEFALADWKAAGLLFPSAVKRGLFTLDNARINRRFGRLTTADQEGQRNRDILLFQAALVYELEVARKRRAATCRKNKNVPVSPPLDTAATGSRHTDRR